MARNMGFNTLLQQPVSHPTLAQQCTISNAPYYDTLPNSIGRNSEVSRASMGRWPGPSNLARYPVPNCCASTRHDWQPGPRGAQYVPTSHPGGGARGMQACHRRQGNRSRGCHGGRCGETEPIRRKRCGIKTGLSIRRLNIDLTGLDPQL